MKKHQSKPDKPTTETRPAQPRPQPRQRASVKALEVTNEYDEEEEYEEGE